MSACWRRRASRGRTLVRVSRRASSRSPTAAATRSCSRSGASRCCRAQVRGALLGWRAAGEPRQVPDPPALHAMQGRERADSRCRRHISLPAPQSTLNGLTGLTDCCKRVSRVCNGRRRCCGGGGRWGRGRGRRKGRGRARCARGLGSRRRTAAAVGASCSLLCRIWKRREPASARMLGLPGPALSGSWRRPCMALGHARTSHGCRTPLGAQPPMGLPGPGK